MGFSKSRHDYKHLITACNQFHHRLNQMNGHLKTTDAK